MKKEKFKKIMKKVLYITLFLSLSITSFDFFIKGFDCLGLSLEVGSVFIDVSYYISSVPFWFSMLFYFVLSYLFSSFALHIFSYHVYTGKKNWYKFFREKEKQQKLQNKLDWQEYCKSLEKKD